MGKARNLSTLLAADGQVEDAKIDGVAASKLSGTIDTARLPSANQTSKLPLTGGAMTGAITTNSTFDTRDVATDGTKLDTIETSATADQTNAEIKTAVEAATDSNTFTDADHTKLNAIEASATADQTAAQIKTAYEGETSAFTDAQFTKLGNIETAATADQTDAEIKTAVEAATNIALGGSPTTTTQAEADDSTKIATTAYVTDKITTLIGGAPSTLNDLNELAAAINDDATYNSTLTTALGTKLPKAGGTMTGTTAHGDNVKSTYGAGADLEIYHDVSGNHSIIAESGTGHLYIKASNLRLQSSTGENFLEGIVDGAVNLYHNDVKKLATTSTGIDITGTVTSDGLVVNSGATNVVASFTSTDGTAGIQLVDSSGNCELSTSSGGFNVQPAGGAAALTVTAGGSVGIGTTSPDAKLQVSVTDTDSTPVNGTNAHLPRGSHSLEASNTSDSALYSGIHLRTRTSGASAWSINNAWSSTYLGDLTFVTRTGGSTAAEHMRINSAGKVGIGTNAPSAILEIAQPSSGAAIIARTNESTASQRAGGGFSSMGSATATNRIAHLWLDADGGNFSGSDYFYIHKKGNSGEAALIQQSNADLKFATSGNTRMTINGSGRVGIGTTSPDDMLHVAGSLTLQEGSPEITFETNSTHVNWQIAAQEWHSAAWQVASGSTDADATNDTWTPRLTVKDSGNVGIGNTNPNHRLNVGGGNISIDDDYGLYWGGSSANRIVGSLGGNYLRFYTNSNERIRIDSSGKVGIRVSDPDSALEIKGLGGGSTLTLKGTDNSGNTNFWVKDGGGVGVHYGPFLINQDHDDTAVPSSTFMYVHHASNPFIIKNDGKVGIGTTAPAGMLHVDGHTSSIHSIFEGNGNGDSVAIQLKVKANNASTSTQGLYGSAGSASTDNFITLGNSNSSGVTVNNSGNVGIGTTAPTALLEIASGAPTFILNANSQATNKKKIRLAASQFTAGDFNIQQMNDDGTTIAMTPLTINNSGDTTIGTSLIADSAKGGDRIICTGTSGTTNNLYQASFYGVGLVNQTYRHCFNIDNATNVKVEFTGGGGNTVFNTIAYFQAEHHLDANIQTKTLYYSDLKIKLVTDGNNDVSVWVAGNTYQNNAYGLQWRVWPSRSCTIEMNPSSSESSRYGVHSATGGSQESGWSSLTSGSGPTVW